MFKKGGKRDDSILVLRFPGLPSMVDAVFQELPRKDSLGLSKVKTWGDWIFCEEGGACHEARGSEFLDQDQIKSSCTLAPRVQSFNHEKHQGSPKADFQVPGGHRDGPPPPTPPHSVSDHWAQMLTPGVVLWILLIGFEVLIC